MNAETNSNQAPLFRDQDGNVKSMLNEVEGFTFRENPLDFFIMLARYKFAARFLEKQHNILDAGCGHGNGSVFLKSFCNKVTGGDFDESHVEKLNKEYANIDNLDFIPLNLLDVSGKEKMFDAVVSMDVIEHFTKKETDIVASNYAKLVKDGGFAVIGTPNIASAPYASERRLKSHIHEFEAQEFKETLQKHFSNVFLFSMTDETVSTSFNKMAWYLMAICTK